MKNRRDHPLARQPPRSEAGSASIWMLLVGMLTLMAFLAVCGLGAVFAARHRAQTAADMAALAAWQQAAGRTGGDQACGEARMIAARNQATLVTCVVSTTDVVVTVEVGFTGWLARLPSVQRGARAGPA